LASRYMPSDTQTVAGLKLFPARDASPRAQPRDLEW
jgi:hypothetical protein